MKIVLAQISPTIGNINKNKELILKEILSIDTKTDLIIFPECALSGYPTKDLLTYESFILEIEKAIADICEFSKTTADLGIIFGTPLRNINKGKSLYNAAVCIHNGKILHTHNKILLPNYDIFDESRYFEPGDSAETFVFKNKKIGMIICEDAWHSYNHKDIHYKTNPLQEISIKKPDILVNLMASPFEKTKLKTRLDLFSKLAKTYETTIICVNQASVVEEVIFDGGSCVFDTKGNLCLLLPQFENFIEKHDTEKFTDLTKIEQDEQENQHKALIFGIKNYIHTLGFKKVVLGLSGGIDSALVATLACKALGNENVLGVLMPSQFSSQGSIDDALTLSKNLNIETITIPISSLHTTYETEFKKVQRDLEGLAGENIQARIRGTLLMALANGENRILLSTGNKSELAVGYSTLYGDMCGGLNPIADLYKTDVYNLAKFINKDKEIIPKNSITKAPSAELRADQKDQDSLPEYELLDAILKLFIEENLNSEEIVQLGFDKEIVNWVIKTVVRNEYKRYQAAPGFKLTKKAFGIGRKFGLTSSYKF